MRSRCRSASRRSRSPGRVGAREAEVRALTVLGGDLAYLGRGEEGLAHFRQALQLAEEIGDPHRPGAGVRQPHRRADDAGTAPGVGATGGRRGSRRCAGTGSTAPCSSPTRSRRCSRSATGTRPNGSAPPRSAASPSSFPYWLLIIRADARDRPRRLRRRASAPRGRERHPARGPRARPLRRLPRRARPLGAPLDGRRRGRPATAWRRRASARRRRSASSCAPRDCARRRSWRRSHAPAGTPTPLRDRLDRARKLLDRRSPRRRRGRRRSRRTPPAGSPLAEAEYERARGAARPELVVRTPQRPGSGSSARRSRPTAAGARPRRSSPPARPAPRRACRSGRRTPSRPGSEPGPCCASSSCSPQRARLDLAPPDASHPTTKQRPGRDPRPDPARGGGAGPRRPRLHQPRDRRRRSSSASRPPASTSRTSCASSTRPTGSRPPRHRPPRPATIRAI